MICLVLFFGNGNCNGKATGDPKNKFWEEARFPKKKNLNF